MRRGGESTQPIQSLQIDALVTTAIKPGLFVAVDVLPPPSAA